MAHGTRHHPATAWTATRRPGATAATRTATEADPSNGGLVKPETAGYEQGSTPNTSHPLPTAAAAAATAGL